MSTRISQAIALGVFACLTSTSIFAAPILINAESGTARSLEGTWEYGCVSPGPGLPDENEVIVFQDSNVEAQLITYTSTDGTCSSGGVATSLGSATATAFDNVTTSGWLLESGAAAAPPMRLDGTGSLAANPVVTKLEFAAPPDPVEKLFYYMDDSAEPWCFYNGVGPLDLVTGFPTFVAAYEPRCKVGVPPVTAPECDIQLNQASFVNGDTVTANVYRLANLSTAPVATEMKFWLDVPGIPPISIANVGSDGSIVLPAGLDFDYGTIPLFPVTAALPRGSYEFSCRFLDPVTGELLAEDRNFFEIQDKTYAIGETGPAGGIVFYITDGGLHGLEAAPVDQGQAQWGCYLTWTEATGTAIGTGVQNTADILAACATSGIAARLADEYTLNGFDDWFLPSKDELNELYLNKPRWMDAFAYWSSSQPASGGSRSAWRQLFCGGCGSQSIFDKRNTQAVRAIRAF